MNNIITQEQFYASVKLVDTKDLFSNETLDILKSKNKAVIYEIDGKEKVVNFCSDTYGLIKNKEIFPVLEEEIKKYFDFEAKYHMYNDATFYVDYVLRSAELDVRTTENSDFLQPNVRIFHSYNGRASFSLKFGFLRLICTNGLWGFKFEENKIYNKHSVNLVGNFVQHSVSEIRSFAENHFELTKKYEELNNNGLTYSPELIIGNIIEKTNFPTRQYDAVVERFNFEAQTLPKTEWLLYNAFNYHLNHSEEFTTDALHRMRLDESIFDLIHSKNYLKLVENE